MLQEWQKSSLRYEEREMLAFFWLVTGHTGTVLSITLLSFHHSNSSNILFFSSDCREHPVDWITRHLEQEGLKILQTKSFNILHSEESALRQIRVAQTKLALMPSNPLRHGMTTYLDELSERVRGAMISSGGKIPLSFDYIIAAELPPPANLGTTIFTMLASPFVGSAGDASSWPSPVDDKTVADSPPATDHDHK